MAIRSYWPNRESWHHYWPSGIVALIATIQLLISFAILGIQICIVLFGMVALCNGVTPRYIMGFVCWGFFFACWISTFCVTCCNRSSVGCATYVLVKNILAFIFSAVLIDFDRKFINFPGFDYNPGDVYGLSSSSCLINLSNNGGTDFLSISISLTKAQLAGAVIILVTSLIYVGIYIYTYIRALGQDGRRSINMPSYGGPRSQTQPKMTTAPQQSSAYSAEPPIDYTPPPLRSHGNSQTIICHKCGTTVYQAERF